MSSKSSSNSRPPPPKIAGYHCVGWVKDAHGIRGELFVRLAAAQADWIDSVDKVDLLKPGSTSLEQWEIEVVRPHKDGLILKLAGINDRNRSEEFAKYLIYIPEDVLVAEEGENIYLHQILGFRVRDMVGEEIGIIEGFGTNGPQDLLRVKRPSGKEALIPFIEPFIHHIDFDNKELKMDLPPGLLSLEEE